MLNEQWAPIAGYEGYYSVSNMGRIRSEQRVVYKQCGKPHSVRERIMSQARKQSGHMSVMLHGPAQKRVHVHRAVALAFVGPQPSAMHEVAHNDGNPGNNAASNLRWATRASNHADKLVHGTHNRGERHPLAKLLDSDVKAIRESRKTCAQIAAEYGISHQHAWAVKAGVSRKHHEL